VTLAEILRRRGYQACAMVTGPLLPETGLHRGFEAYQYRQREEHLYSDWRKRLNGQLDTLARQREPWFFFLHLWELHEPCYLSPTFNRRQFGKARYERALSSLDNELGKILERIDFERTIVVLHGDHGERYERTIVERVIRKLKRRVLGWSAGRGWYKLGHGYHVYDVLVRVPLIFVGQGLFPAGTRIDAQVRQIDILPTILEALGIGQDTELKIHGESLLPLVSGERMGDRPALIEACGQVIPDPRKRLMGIRVPPWKYVFAPHDPKILPELYRLHKDPSESTNLVNEQPAIAEELRAAINATQYRLEQGQTDAPMTREERKMVEERLRELGYID